jgi:hypothetical protein
MNTLNLLALNCTLLALAGGCTWTGQRTLSGTGGSDGGGQTGEAGRPNRPDGSGTVVDAGPPSLDGACMVVKNPVGSLPPDLLLVLDRSFSMRDAPPTGGGSKWTQMTAGVNASIAQTQTTVRWGLEFFGNNTGDLCGLSPTVDVAIAPMAAASIAAAITGSGQPSSSTPTTLALHTAGAYLRALPDQNPKFIVLATDGLPTCNPSGLPGNTQVDDSAAAIGEVTTQAAMGTPTFVIGIGTSGASMATANATLNQMATAGGHARAATPAYFPADNTTDLTTALSMISGQVAHSCIYPLPSTTSVTDPIQLGVYGDGNLIPYDATQTNGWAFTTAAPPYTAIELYGSFCAGVMNMTIVDVEIALTCIVP